MAGGTLSKGRAWLVLLTHAQTFHTHRPHLVHTLDLGPFLPSTHCLGPLTPLHSLRVHPLL